MVVGCLWEELAMVCLVERKVAMVCLEVEKLWKVKVSLKVVKGWS